MSLGRIDTSILTDIGNAIRYQAGVATTYRPLHMAAAILALDGTNSGNYTAQSYMALEDGVLSSAILDDIADAIRAQNESNTTYQPEDMAQAILDLNFTPVARALLLTDGTLEFKYSRNPVSSLGTVSQAFTVDTSGYASSAARPWYSVRDQVLKVVIDSSWASVGMTNYDYFFNAQQSMTEVVGFQYLTAMTSATQMFVSCGALESIYATSFTNNITSGSLMFNGCNKLVGGTDFFVPASTSNYTVCKLGSDGVLTDPDNDNCEWGWGFAYDDGTLGIGASSSDLDATKTLLGYGRFCAGGLYQLASGLPWYDYRSSITTVKVLADMATAGFSVLNMRYWFYAYTGITNFVDLGNLGAPSSMRYAFTSCTGITSLNLTGLDPSNLTDLFYCFGGCNNLVTITVDSTWALPASGLSGSQCFYSCSSLVGGNNTAWSSSNTSYTYMVIDTASTPGYLTAAAAA